MYKKRTLDVQQHLLTESNANRCMHYHKFLHMFRKAHTLSTLGFKNVQLIHFCDEFVRLNLKIVTGVVRALLFCIFWGSNRLDKYFTRTSITETATTLKKNTLNQ